MVTPSTGTIFAKGLTGNCYAVEFYVSDVVGSSARFDGGAGANATSPDFYSFPEPVIVSDISIITGATVATKMRITANGSPTPNVITYAVHLVTLTARPQLSIKLKAGTRLSAIQMTA